ncbi:MAG: phosphoribosylformylglycinamidine synthase, partial [Rikenellaceae bacterium]
GTGGEIRDRIAGGKGAFPMAGTAVYMTSYPRPEDGRTHEGYTSERKWLYQTPSDILIKASNGASDFGNKFGQPLICGSLDTFEHFENGDKYGFDKVIMLAGGVGYGKKIDCLKDEPETGDTVVLLGGDNYRIGMGGGAVSSVATGEYTNSIELNAVQRSNPEMQKRVYNAIRAISEEDINPVISIHDHGAGGHLNCLSELVEATGGRIDVDKLPIGDPTLSGKEIIGNESQERMGLVMKEENVDKLAQIAARERAPMYVIGEATGDMRFTFVNNNNGEKPIDLQLEDMFGKAPRTVMTDKATNKQYAEPQYSASKINRYINDVLQLEAVACKDWLTNKVDRSVTGRIALQQTVGRIQLPLNNCGVVAMDFQGKTGMATAIGHAPAAALADPRRGSVLAITESLTNIMFVPIEGGLSSISLSANWMWPCNNEGENARLYSAVEAASDYALGLGINIPTGKDSLSMTQKYPNDQAVVSPGTVIISSAGPVSDIKKCVTPVLKDAGGQIVYVDLCQGSFGLGGSAFAQVQGAIGQDVPTVENADYFKKAFAAIQELIENETILAAHDISAGGLITALAEMTFANNHSGLNIDLSPLAEQDLIKVLFSERPSAVLQVADGAAVVEFLKAQGVDACVIGASNNKRELTIKHNNFDTELLIDNMREFWYRSSFLLDKKQSGDRKAAERYMNYKFQPLEYTFPEGFEGTLAAEGLEQSRRTRSGVKAAIIREKGSNGDREMAWCLHLAGFDVKDVHMTDLISGRETLDDINMIVFVGGFSNSDVLNSAKGWAGAFLYNEKARETLNRFYEREDTLSLGVCNGCQLMVELGLITPNHNTKPKMLHNDSHKFESGFVGVNINPTKSIMLKELEGCKLGIWIAHGEGKFNLPLDSSEYDIPMSYSYAGYPANPNGSDYNAAAICSADGRHLAMMPHLERAIRDWNWPCYPQQRKDEVTPWIKAFVGARKWIESNK